jgi:hypothetical protein
MPTGVTINFKPGVALRCAARTRLYGMVVTVILLGPKNTERRKPEVGLISDDRSLIRAA